jgi:hypothetical protein
MSWYFLAIAVGAVFVIIAALAIVGFWIHIWRDM